MEPVVEIQVAWRRLSAHIPRRNEDPARGRKISGKEPVFIRFEENQSITCIPEDRWCGRDRSRTCLAGLDRSSSWTISLEIQTGRKIQNQSGGLERESCGGVGWEWSGAGRTGLVSETPPVLLFLTPSLSEKLDLHFPSSPEKTRGREKRRWVRKSRWSSTTNSSKNGNLSEALL